MHRDLVILSFEWLYFALASSIQVFLVMQFEALAGFSAIIDRLGEFSEVVDSFASPSAADDQNASNGASSSTSSKIGLVDLPSNANSGTLLSLEHLTLQTPNGLRTLVQDLTLQVSHLLKGLHGCYQSQVNLWMCSSTQCSPIVTKSGIYWPAADVQWYDRHSKLSLCTMGHVQVAKGDSLLIVGPSGTGKTSLLRAIAGLWSSGSGTITRCRSAAI